MRFTDDADTASGYLIQGYEPGTIQIAGQRYREGLLIAPRRLVPGWGPDEASELTAAHIAELLSVAPRLIVLGTGRHQVFPPPAVLAAPLQQGIGVEVMDTGAACRTYNILVAEGRDVVAGLLMIR